jgi:hypothetical protein
MVFLFQLQQVHLCLKNCRNILLAELGGTGELLHHYTRWQPVTFVLVLRIMQLRRVDSFVYSAIGTRRIKVPSNN